LIALIIIYLINDLLIINVIPIIVVIVVDYLISMLIIILVFAITTFLISISHLITTYSIHKSTTLLVITHSFVSLVMILSYYYCHLIECNPCLLN